MSAKQAPLAEPRNDAQFVQWARNVNLKLNGKTTIADATDAATTMARLNDLLAELRTIGVIR